MPDHDELVDRSMAYGFLGSMYREVDAAIAIAYDEGTRRQEISFTGLTRGSESRVESRRYYRCAILRERQRAERENRAIELHVTESSQKVRRVDNDQEGGYTLCSF